MKQEFSKFLEASKPLIRALVDTLKTRYAYVSVFAQDATAKRISVSRRGIGVSEDGRFSKRGFVVRVHNGKGLGEYSFNEISEALMPRIIEDIALCAKGIAGSDPVPADEPASGTYSSEYEIDPDTVGTKALIEKLSALREKALSQDARLTDIMTGMTWQKSHMMFISPNRTLTQSLLWTNASLVAIAADNGDMKDYYQPFSGLCGAELLNDITPEVLSRTVNCCIELLGCDSITPGEYECICSPEVTGMIVHEAFGHGVEMDMFVKDRAQARIFMNKPVASDIVVMRDGAKSAKECASYLFDDEGTLGSDTLVIDKGTLVSGYCDAVSAARLGIKPTGNGRRESYERKAYTRMTNTFFEAGSDKLEDMIASIKYGFMLENPSSGMEDPKNWGIQCMVNVAREIKDGAFTGKVFSPIVLTGYVPDLLKSISMISDKVELGGSGFCGKGYKEWVKVSDGGAYIKARIRLG